MHIYIYICTHTYIWITKRFETIRFPVFGGRCSMAATACRVLQYRNIGALVITYTILGTPYQNYSTYTGPQSPILTIKAPIMLAFYCSEL